MGNEFTNKILKLALPITAQQFMLALVSACDAFMLGGLNQNSLSAISLASQITFVFNLILTALTIGENMFVAQYYGKRDFDGLRTSAGLVLRYVFIISILFLLATFFIPEMLMRLFTNDTILIDYGIKYLKVIGLSYIFSGVLQVLQGILKNCGYAGRCTIISAVVVCVNIILNVILNVILIYGYMGFPRMEIAGAALATVIANGLGLVITIYILHLKKEFWIGVKDIKSREVHITRKFWKHVYPVLFNELAWGGGFTMYSVILGHLGSDAIAANSIANITKNLLICGCTGFGYGGKSIHEGYIEAVNQLNIELVNGENKPEDIWRWKQQKKETKQLWDLNELKRLQYCVEAEDLEEVEKVIDSYFLKWKDVTLDDMELLQVQLLNIYFYFYTSFGDRCIDAVAMQYMNFYENVKHAENILELKNAFLIGCQALQEMLRGRETAADSYKLIYSMKQYIKENLDDPDFSLGALAKAYYMNSSYLSRFFKEKVKSSFVEYLTEQRIDKAKQLLQYGNFKIYEVGEKVGIYNANYFGILFKKKVGVTPAEYRKQYEK